MEPIPVCPRRSSDQLGPGSGEDRISALTDDVLLIILTCVGCVRTAARTGVLSRRWLGLWARLRRIIFRGVPFPSLEAALGGVSRPPQAPGLSLLDFCIHDKRPRPDAAGITSLLSAAALHEPKELVLVLASRHMGLDSPMFFLQLPADVRFPALETLSLSGCHVRFDSFLPWCPRLRVLRVKFNDHGFHEEIHTFMAVHSASLQELSVEAHDVHANAVDLVVPELRQLTVSLRADAVVDVSVVAPKLDKVSWQWFYAFIKFGLWRIWKFRLERQGHQLPSLHIHARITGSIVHGDEENNTHEIEKHLIAKFSVLELHLKAKGHVYGAFVFHILGMNPYFRRTRRLKVVLQGSAFKQDCPLDCACDQPDWRSQTISLTALEQVEIRGFEGYDHEIHFLKLILKCAPMLKIMNVVLPPFELTSAEDKCTQIYNIFRAYPSVECFLCFTSWHGIYWRTIEQQRMEPTS